MELITDYLLLTKDWHMAKICAQRCAEELRNLTPSVFIPATKITHIGDYLYWEEVIIDIKDMRIQNFTT